MRLLAHFWRLVLTSGTRALRLVSVSGLLMALVGVAAALYLVIRRLTGGAWPQGWASTMVVLLVLGGIILVFLGVVAEYIGVAVNQAMGKPPYLVISDPQQYPGAEFFRQYQLAVDAQPFEDLHEFDQTI